MLRFTAFAGALLCLFSIVGLCPVVAAKLHPRCNIDFPCIVQSDAGHVSKRDARRIARADRFRNVEFGSPMYPPETARSFLGGDLVSKARQYMGGNPTGWRSLWCGRFMAMIAPQAAARIRNPNLA